MHADPKAGAATVERLVRRAQDGDHDAFARLVEMFKGKIYNYVLRMLGDPDSAEDVAQEAFIKAYSSIVDFRGASSFQTWLYRIAGNLAIDTMRRRKYRQGNVSLDQPMDTSDGEVERDIPDERAGPDRELQSAQLKQKVDEAILKLSPKLRTVVLLYELQGLSYEDIARVVGAPLGTVKSRLFNAREQLKRMLADDAEVYLQK